ncbi:MAG: type II toxin-antitoxin system prevent-host-death family antitoxin [Sphingorhabdus sp.]
MIHQILADAGVSISDLKKNPSAVIAAADGFPIAILNRNTPAAYLVPAKAWEAIMDQLEDMELVKIVREREGQEAIPVKIEDLLNLEDI